MREKFYQHLTITFEQKHVDTFIRYCRKVLADNGKQLKYVSQLTQEYCQHTPIWWYTCKYFLYSMLSRGLRTMNADLMIKLGFFISNLYRHIAQFTSYRADKNVIV